MGKECLEFLGYQVEAFHSSSEALEYFRWQPDKFALVITDMTMPKMTGFELAKELMRIKPDTPVIFCTGHSNQVTPEKVKKLGIKHLLMKPWGIEQVAKVIRSVLDEKI